MCLKINITLLFLCYLSCPSTSSYYHQAMIPILHRIVITDVHPVLVAASSSTVLLLLSEQNIYWNTPPGWSSWNYLSNELSFAWNGFQQESCVYFTPAMQSVQSWFQAGPQSQDQRRRCSSQDQRRRCSSIRLVWLVGGRSDRCATTASRSFEAEDMHRDRKACVEAKQVCVCGASVRWCYEEVSQKALRGRVS
jgi:hypothetical protein